MNKAPTIVDVDGVPCIAAADIRPGIMIDLEGDVYCDPLWESPDGGNPLFTFEFSTVYEVDTEDGPDGPVIVIDTSHGAFGLPHDHLIGVNLDSIKDGEGWQ